MQNDTIAAIATAMSPSGIGIIRISGDDALSVIDRIYKSKNNKKKIIIIVRDLTSQVAQNAPHREER